MKSRQTLLNFAINLVSILAPYIFGPSDAPDWHRLPYSYYYNSLVPGTHRTLEQYCLAPTDFEMSSINTIKLVYYWYWPPQSKAAFYVLRRGLCQAAEQLSSAFSNSQNRFWVSKHPKGKNLATWLILYAQGKNSMNEMLL